MFAWLRAGTPKGDSGARLGKSARFRPATTKRLLTFSLHLTNRLPYGRGSENFARHSNVRVDARSYCTFPLSMDTRIVSASGCYIRTERSIGPGGFRNNRPDADTIRVP